MKAVIYARYSSHNQTEQSIEGQLRDNYAWAKQQEIDVIAEYIDRAKSGTKDTREGFQRMIADAAKKQFQMVIVWKLDRFARNRYDSAIYKAKLKKYGVRVVSVKEAITDSPEGIILEGLLESMAEYYSANLSQNVKRGMRETTAKGFFAGGQIPYGYKVQDRKLVADEKMAPAVQYLFEQYSKGVPKKEIIAELSNRGYRQKNGKPLTFQSFGRVLVNPVYIGEYTRNGEVVPNLATALIDRDTFDLVQEKIRANAHAPAASKAKVEYLLQGKVFCGGCGSPMVAENGRSRNGHKYYYYACSSKKGKRLCNKKNEQKEYLETYVVSRTVKYILSPEMADKIAKAVVAEYKKEFSASGIESVQKAILKIDVEMNKLVDAVLDLPKAARKTAYDKMESLGAQKASLEEELAKLKIANQLELTEAEVRSWLKSFSGGDVSDKEFCRRVIDVFVNSVFVYDDRIVVFYNIRGGKQLCREELYSAMNGKTDGGAARGSNLSAFSPPNTSKIEPFYVFVSGVFGCVFYRNEAR